MGRDDYDRKATQRSAVLDVLVDFTGVTLTPDRINTLHELLCTMMADGPCAWAFQASKETSDGTR